MGVLVRNGFEVGREGDGGCEGGEAGVERRGRLLDVCRGFGNEEGRAFLLHEGCGEVDRVCGGGATNAATNNNAERRFGGSRIVTDKYAAARATVGMRRFVLGCLRRVGARRREGYVGFDGGGGGGKEGCAESSENTTNFLTGLPLLLIAACGLGSRLDIRRFGTLGILRRIVGFVGVNVGEVKAFDERRWAGRGGGRR